MVMVARAKLTQLLSARMLIISQDFIGGKIVMDMAAPADVRCSWSSRNVSTADSSEAIILLQNQQLLQLTPDMCDASQINDASHQLKSSIRMARAYVSCGRAMGHAKPLS